MKTGFLITAYKQIELVEQNIIRIKNYKKLSNSIIVVVSTSEIDIGFKKLERYENVFVIEYMDAIPCNDLMLNLAKRIFNSIQKGLLFMKDLSVEVVLHLHGDTYWDENKENNLLFNFNDVINNNYLISGDIDIHSEYNPLIPKNIHFHPEALIFNIKECIKYNYGFTLGELWDNKEFKSHNYASPEALIGQSLIFYLSGENIISPNQKIPQIYFEKVKIRNYRTYHGVFPDGLINLK
jgi:hypothetical protein